MSDIDDIISPTTTRISFADNRYERVYKKMASNFFPKIFFNIIKTHKGTIADSWFLKDLRKMPPEEFGTKWQDYYDKLVKKAEKTEASKYGYTPISIEEGAEIAELIRANDKIVKADWELEYNVETLTEFLDLTRTESLILNLSLLVYEIDWVVQDSLDRVCLNANSSIDLYSRFLDLPKNEIKKAMDGFLFKSGFLTENKDLRHTHTISEDLSDMFCNNVLSKDNIEDVFFPSNMSTELTIDRYPHLTKEINISTNIINKSLKDPNSKGVNVMFWGIPGTGKTELTLALAKKNNWDLKIVGDISESNAKEKSRAERLISLKIAMKFFSNKPNIVLLFDEMEDLFKDEKDQSFSKAFINRIIETTKIPIIWTTNSLSLLGGSVLRRMTYNIEFGIPPMKARKEIWNVYDKKYNLNLPEETIDNFAMNFDMAPALINNAAKITNLSDLSHEEIPDILVSLDTLVRYGDKRNFDLTIKKDTPYDISVVNTSTNLEVLTNRLLKAKPNFNICLYGAPGTGKSEYARYLAKKLGMKIIFKRASDLISMWLGQTEKNIAQAFKDATQSECMLLIDEGDSFLASRAGAQRSWEVTQVNEILSQMEMNTFPFIITTNLMDNLDEAALRRFTFKVKFDFLTPANAAKLFKEYFNSTAPSGILDCSILTPGDFANVKRKVDILNITDANEILQLLVDECDLKPQKTKSIGFKQ